MNQYQYKNYVIEVFDDSEHRFGSDVNRFNYSKYYFGENKEKLPVSRHGIRVLKNNKSVEDCIVIGFANPSSVKIQSSLLIENQLYVCCCDTVFCLSIPDLKLKWKHKEETSECIKIVKIENDFLCFNGMEVSRINNRGDILWTYKIKLIDDSGLEKSIDIVNDLILIRNKYHTITTLDFQGNIVIQENQ